MSDLSTRATMGEDLALRVRVGIILTRLALDVLAEAPLPDDAPLPDRLAFERRHEYARQVMGDPLGLPVRQAQWAAAAWRASALPTNYALTGAAGVQDSDLEWTLTQVWTALAGG